jgi:hypothetical protein
MSRLDDRIRDGLREPGFERPAKPDSDRVVADVRRRRARQHVVRKAQFGALAVVVLLATGGGFVLLQRAFRVDVIAPGSATPTASVAGELGLGPICRVSSMPIVTTAGEGTAWVFERSSDAGCPDANEGDWGVGVDIDGDDLADASTGPLADCFMLCEAFAAPDVDGDGLSEVAVSTAGADGYGVWLYHVTF